MKSKCCKAKIKTVGDVTQYYVCDECGGACDAEGAMSDVEKKAREYAAQKVPEPKAVAHACNCPNCQRIDSSFLNGGLDRAIRRTDIADGYIQGYQDAQQDAQPKWVSVKDRLPESNIPDNGDNDHLHFYSRSRTVLAYWRKTVVLGHFADVLRNKWDSRREQWFECAEGGSLDLVDITHWQDLPEPPEGE